MCLYFFCRLLFDNLKLYVQTYRLQFLDHRKIHGLSILRRVVPERMVNLSPHILPSVYSNKVVSADRARIWPFPVSRVLCMFRIVLGHWRAKNVKVLTSKKYIARPPRSLYLQSEWPSTQCKSFLPAPPPPRTPQAIMQFLI